MELMSSQLTSEELARLRDPGIMVTNEKTLKQGLEGFKKHVEHMEEPYKSMYSYYAENTQIIADPLRGVYIGYDPTKDVLVYNRRVLGVVSRQQSANIIYSHEFAHRHDVLVVKSWENKNFTDAISSATQAIASDLSKYQDIYAALDNVNPAYQDILHVLSDGKVKTRFGHDSLYEKAKALEIFANLSYIHANHIETPAFDGVLQGVIDEYAKMHTGVI